MLGNISDVAPDLGSMKIAFLRRAMWGAEYEQMKRISGRYFGQTLLM
jgi:hypothetical protein